MSDETREDENAVLRVGLDEHEEAVGEDTGEEDTGAVGGGEDPHPQSSVTPGAAHQPLASLERDVRHERGDRNTGLQEQERAREHEFERRQREMQWEYEEMHQEMQRKRE